jgi:hypothetical protein
LALAAVTPSLILPVLRNLHIAFVGKPYTQPAEAVTVQALVPGFSSA